MIICDFILRVGWKIYRIFHGESRKFWDTSRVKYKGQEANDFVRNAILSAQNGLMVTKFGTIELNSICSCKRYEEGFKFSDYLDYMRGKGCLYPNKALIGLCSNAGFFPASVDLEFEYTDLVLEDIKLIDILGSYAEQECYLEQELAHCKKIDIYGYCAPFAYENPWTSALKGKKVLVVHPFTESIKKQYAIREKLYEDPNVLPEFKELYLVKAVQSIAGNGENTGFADWFEALHVMEEEIDSYDYDVALIGCGAYGMSFAAHCKRNGKIAIHMASWVQMLFGIYGQRWAVDQPEYADFINEYWTRPLKSEKPKNADVVENGAYW
ncbi:hypothetical protein [[Clostridium] fimetarium]|uniref:Uncharacterized protein n=1 Tax=[Clostridium] fimetarium TaxID=99656 RepID=A0A1I0RN43_9FIRM|nr:hypothetical protein [[Clostridium] fimetarium]SEW42630.1 hypothetical protein SAMN05421659_11954 [[Clostridium] fimetarium]